MAPRYLARIAKTAEDLGAVQALRARVFRAGASDADSFDPACTHILIEDQRFKRPACAFRMQAFDGGAEISQSYAAQFYNLERLQSFDGKLLEIGRFCLDPMAKDPDILRLAWAMMAAYVEAHNIELIFGCSSFSGANSTNHLAAFAQLNANHLGPSHYAPRVKALDVVRFSTLEPAPQGHFSPAPLPPLLRSYLLMGAWVSDHAVIDTDLDTTHVFTGLEISAMPAARKKLLHAAGRTVKGAGMLA